MPDELDVFAICPARSIEHRGAKTFNLSRYDQSGAAVPFSILIVRADFDAYVGYINKCPHEDSPLDHDGEEVFTQDRKFLRCGKHGATFDIETGVCADGPCKSKVLEPVALAVIDGDICLCGIKLVEDDSVPDPFADEDEMPEVVILSD